MSAEKNVITIMADRPSSAEALKNKGKDGGLYEMLDMWQRSHKNKKTV